MYKLCTMAAAAERQRFLENQLKELLALREYGRINVSSFCQFAGIPRKTFYRYFSGMDGALYALLDHTLLDMNWNPLQWLRGKEEDLRRELEALFTLWHARRDLLDALVQSRLEIVLMERALICAFRGPQAEVFHFRPDPGSPEEMAVCCMVYTLITWQRSGFRKSAGQIAGELTGLLRNPLARRE